jgi:hypothetical protein
MKSAYKRPYPHVLDGPESSFGSNKLLKYVSRIDYYPLRSLWSTLGVSTLFGHQWTPQTKNFVMSKNMLNISTKCQPGFVVNTFVEMFKMEIVEK